MPKVEKFADDFEGKVAVFQVNNVYIYVRALLPKFTEHIDE